MKKIQNIAALFLIVAVAVLCIVSILGVWDFFDKDVITKSFETLGLLALVAVIVMVSGQFIEGCSSQIDPNIIVAPNPIFKSIRRITLGVLIASVSVLALLGVLAIWDVISDKDVLYKSIGSVAILAFSAFIMVMTCLQREDSPMLKNNKGNPVGILIAILVVGFLLATISGLFR